MGCCACVAWRRVCGELHGYMDWWCGRWLVGVGGELVYEQRAGIG
jgi:hypothetical protein